MPGIPSFHAIAAMAVTIAMFVGFARGRLSVEIVSLLTIAAIALTGAFAGGAEAIIAASAGAAIIQYQSQIILGLGEQRAMHEEGISELAESFQGEVQPMVVELDSTNLRLTGTAAAQYEEWQRLLRDVYLAENAVIADIYMVPNQPTKETWIGNNTLPMLPSPQNFELQ